MKKIFPLFAVIIVLVLAVCSFHIIPTGYTGVKTSFGQIQETTIQSGKLNFCIPFVQSIHKVNNKQQDKHIEAQVWGEAADKTPVYAADVIVTYQVNGIKNIKNVGFQKGEALEKLIREARFSIYPSEWYENCPFSVMESQMYGTPVLGADIGGIPELIQVGKTGELFESGNAEDLKKKIEKLWGDKELCEQYSKNCKDISFDTIDEYYEKIMKVYR